MIFMSSLVYVGVVVVVSAELAVLVVLVVAAEDRDCVDVGVGGMRTPGAATAPLDLLFFLPICAKKIFMNPFEKGVGRPQCNHTSVMEAVIIHNLCC
jgi:hypothetical protein